MKTINSSQFLRQTLTAFAIFLLAFLPRLGAIERYVTPDELHWVSRSIHFATALSQANWPSTIQSGHPGVVTMWLGALGITAQRFIDPSKPLAVAPPDYQPQNATAMRYLAQFLTAARLPVILVVSINIAILFLLLSRLVNRRAAFLAAGLVALDPFSIALGGILHVDALMVTFSLNALAALSIALNRPRPARWLIVSGALAGLAMLSKSPAVVLSVATLVIVAADDLRHHRPITHMLRVLLLWGVSAALFFGLLYPAMWTSPLAALQRMSTTAEKFSETAHAVNFFNGRNDRDPGPLFYPAVVAFRSTPIIWLGLIAALVLIVRAKSEEERRMRQIAWVYWVFALVFIGVITLGAKKLDRYALPALSALNIVGALGLAFALERLGQANFWTRIRPRQTFVLNSAVAIILCIAALPLTMAWPLPLRAYNPLLGGYTGARRVLPVGGGESAEVGRALAKSTFATKTIALSDVVGTAPFFSGALTTTDASGFASADYLLFTASDYQLTPDTTQKWLGVATPVMTITVQNQPFAWLYPNQWLAMDRQHLSDQRRPNDALILDFNGAIAKDSATTLLSSEIDEASAVDLLRQIAQSHDRVWVIHYAASPRRIMSPLLSLLDTYAINLDQWSSPLSEGALYALPENLSFTAQPAPLNGGVNFGERIRLNQAESTMPRVQPGQSIGVMTQWSAGGPQAQAVVTLVDAVGHQWSLGAAQVPLLNEDNAPRARRISVPVPLTIPPGEYQLVMNVLDVQSGSALSTRDANGEIGGTEWLLGLIAIDPSQTPIDPTTRIPPIVLKADLDGIRPIGSDAPPDPIIAGDPWTLSMEWMATVDHLPALDIQWSLVAGGQTVYSTTMPLNPYPTDRWRSGAVLQSKYDFRLPLDVRDGVYELRFKPIEQASGKLWLEKPLLLTQVHVASRPRSFTPPEKIDYPLGMKFDDLATLLGANVQRSDQAITVTLFWQAAAITSTTYTTFVQLLGPGEQVVKQIDNWQIAFDAPTSTWQPGQVVADQYVFEGAAAAPQVGVGLYNAANGQRVPVRDARGQPLPEDRVLIK